MTQNAQRTTPPPTTTPKPDASAGATGADAVKATLVGKDVGAQTAALTPPENTPKPPEVTEFDTWDLCYAAMTDQGKLGYDQFVALNGKDKAAGPLRGCTEKNGKFSKTKASALWASRAMTKEAFDKKLADKKKLDVSDIKGIITTINHLCDETDGKNRPGADMGDGTSEAALLWEAENGEPYKSGAGHHMKLRDYCKNIKEGLAEIQAKKGSVDPTDAATLGDITLVIARGQARYDKMRDALLVWNARVGTYPTKWNADGTSKVPPPGVSPKAGNKLVAGWPSPPMMAIP